MATSKNTPTEPTEILPQEDYDAIEGAVMETARGRWFLAEYARRHRVADTEMLMNAISKLERSLSDQATISAPKSKVPAIDDQSSTPEPNDRALEKVLLDVAELSAAIQLTRQEIEELGTKQANDGGFEQASNELDAIVTHTEQATGEILTAAEAIQEAAWTLRDQGTDPEICDKLDNYAIEIYTACTFQDITGQRIAKVVSLMGFVEGHVQSMMGIWHEGEAAARAAKQSPDEKAGGPEGSNADSSSDVFDEADLLNGPALEGSGLEQGNIDDLLNDGFDAIESGTGEVTSDIDDGFDAIETGVDAATASIDDGFDAIETDVDEASASIDDGFDAIETEVDEATASIDDGFDAIETDVDETTACIDDGFDAIETGDGDIGAEAEQEAADVMELEAHVVPEEVGAVELIENGKTEDPYAGQDAFESTEETLQRSKQG